MKDKLRELAEMVREAYRAGFIAACKWPAPVSQDVDSSAYNREFNSWSFSVREKHAAILDAEGDGGAVDFSGTSFVCYLIDKCEGSMISEESLHGWIADFLKNPQYSGNTHPARSGVVSDEDVRDAERWRVFVKALRSRLPGPAHGTRIKVVEICPMYGEEKDVGDVTALIDAAIQGRTP